MSQVKHPQPPSTARSKINSSPAKPQESALSSSIGKGAGRPSITARPSSSPQSHAIMTMSMSGSLMSPTSLDASGEASGGRVRFGGRNREREKRVADRARARYQRVLQDSRRKAAVHSLIDWWKRVAEGKRARRQVAAIRSLRLVLNAVLLRFVLKFKKQKQERLLRMAKAQAVLDAQQAAVSRLQRWWRCALARLVLLKARRATKQALAEVVAKEHLHRKVSIIQALWRRRRVHKLHSLRLAVMKRKRASIIVTTVRKHFALNAARDRAQFIRTREHWAASLIAKCYREHREHQAARQQRFLANHQLPMPTLLLSPNKVLGAARASQRVA